MVSHGRSTCETMQDAESHANCSGVYIGRTRLSAHKWLDNKEKVRNCLCQNDSVCFVSSLTKRHYSRIATVRCQVTPRSITTLNPFFIWRKGYAVQRVCRKTCLLCCLSDVSQRVTSPFGSLIGPPTAFRRNGPSVPWCPCRDPLGDDSSRVMNHQSANPLWLCRVSGQGRDRGRELSCGLVMWTSFTHAFFKRTSSAREVWLSSLPSRFSLNWFSRVTSAAPLACMWMFVFVNLSSRDSWRVSPSFRSCAA